MCQLGTAQQERASTPTELLPEADDWPIDHNNTARKISPGETACLSMITVEKRKNGVLTDAFSSLAQNKAEINEMLHRRMNWLGPVLTYG